MCIGIYGSTSGVKTIHKETAPSLTLVSNYDNLLFKSNLNFDGIASEKKMVGYAKLRNSDYKVAKCVWNGKHTIKLIPLNKSGQALVNVADYCRKNKAEKNNDLKLKVYKSYTTAEYKTKQGQITITAKAKTRLNVSQRHFSETLYKSAIQIRNIFNEIFPKIPGLKSGDG